MSDSGRSVPHHGSGGVSVPVVGVLQAWAIRRDLGVKAERMLQNLVAKVVAAVSADNYGRNVLENVYLAGFEHGATMMERKLQASDAKGSAQADGVREHE